MPRLGENGVFGRPWWFFSLNLGMQSNQFPIHTCQSIHSSTVFVTFSCILQEGTKCGPSLIILGRASEGRKAPAAQRVTAVGLVGLTGLWTGMPESFPRRLRLLMEGRQGSLAGATALVAQML